LAHKRPGSCAGKGLLTEAGLKSPIFYSEDFAIDGAAMLEKLSTNADGRHLSQRMSRHRTGRAERILVEYQERAAVVGFVKDPAGVAALHVAKREGKDFRLCQVGTGFNRKSSL
jgi:bifunctional non-homologous end joining protein LigD